MIREWRWRGRCSPFAAGMDLEAILSGKVPVTFTHIEFSPNVFREFSQFSDKSICHYSKRSGPCHLLCATTCYNSTSRTHMKDRIFLNWLKFMPPWFYCSPWICWIQWILVPFRENSHWHSELDGHGEDDVIQFDVKRKQTLLKRVQSTSVSVLYVSKY